MAFIYNISDSFHLDSSHVTTRLEVLLKPFGGTTPADVAILEELNDEAQNGHLELSWYDEDKDNEFKNKAMMGNKKPSSHFSRLYKDVCTW